MMFDHPRPPMYGDIIREMLYGRYVFNICRCILQYRDWLEWNVHNYMWLAAEISWRLVKVKCSIWALCIYIFMARKGRKCTWWWVKRWWHGLFDQCLTIDSIDWKRTLSEARDFIHYLPLPAMISGERPQGMDCESSLSGLNYVS